MADSKTLAAEADEPIVAAVEPAPIVTAKGVTYVAPEHISAVHFSTGRVIGVVDGQFVAPSDLIPTEIGDLARLGFNPA